MRTSIAPALLLCALAATAAAQAPAPVADTARAGASAGARGAMPWIDLPVADLPYNAAGGVRAPSMEQALGVTQGFYEASHRLVEDAWGGRRWPARASVLAFDWITLALPGGDAWLHEEYHRAVLGRRGIDSRNDVYRMDLGAEAIAVSHVADDELARLKRDHPAEQVRLGSAGMEGEYRLVQALEKNRFFRGSRGWHLPLYWMVKLETWGYLDSGTWPETDDDTDRMNAQDGADVSKRDFTGHDFTAWVYDLHRPAEPYAARGVHPSGVGIDRYVKPADLTAEETKYLKRQSRLGLLNLLDPNLVGFDGIAVASPLNGRPLRLSLSLGHLLTPFGHTVDANLFVKQGATNLFVVFHGYGNGDRLFPGVEAEVIEQPVDAFGARWTVSPRAAAWLQPYGLAFRTERARPGGLLSLKVHRGDTGRLRPYLELEAKTAGWVAGNAYLDAGLAARMGISIR